MIIVQASSHPSQRQNHPRRKGSHPRLKEEEPPAPKPLHQKDLKNRQKHPKWGCESTAGPAKGKQPKNANQVLLQKDNTMTDYPSVSRTTKDRMSLSNSLTWQPTPQSVIRAIIATEMGCRVVLLAAGNAADSALVNAVEIEAISPSLLLMFPPMRDVLQHLHRIP